MPVLRQIFDAKGKYRRCEHDDIGPHFLKISQFIPELEHLSFQERMMEAVEEGDAWCLGGAFLYYTRENKRISHGVAMFGMGVQMDFLALLIGVFSFEDHDTHIMRFGLHEGKEIQEYKTLLTVTSIKRTHKNPNLPLLIRVDDFRVKMIKLLKAAGIRP
jgi:hypothetical protein